MTAPPGVRRGCFGCPAWEPVEIALRGLRAAVAFQRLSGQDWKSLSPEAALREYEGGERLFHEGLPHDRVFVVTSGRMKLCKATAIGREVIVRFAGPGELLGFLGAGQGPAPMSAVAIEDGTCVVMPLAAFSLLLERQPWLARGLLHGLLVKLDEMTSRTAEVAGGRVEERFARMFLRLAGEVGSEADNGLLIRLSLTRQDLADLAGTALETSIRLMARWERRHMVHTARDGFVVLDLGALERLATRRSFRR